MGRKRLDIRSEALLWGTLPRAQKAFRALLAELELAGLVARVVSGTRTYPEQATLYAQGRTAAGQRVTNARAGESNHNFGLAIDIGLFDGGRYLTGATAAEVALYDRAGAIGREIKGLEWGGDWESGADRPHYQLGTGLDRHELRRRFEAGLSYW